jgi:hypothetical protein|tara:strand:+ start:43 stop:495 length:453 start_codon:yes stop_codon:yes gene_type:complete
MAYSGRYPVSDPKKYDGDSTKVYYRSLWERQVFKWCERNPQVLRWSSEETIIPYKCKTDNRIHRYFVDVKIKLDTGETYLIEIKPKKETIAPKKPARQTKKYVTEVMTYVKNQSKWEAAEEYCMQRGWKFVVWTEDTLKSLGIKLLTAGK